MGIEEEILKRKKQAFIGKRSTQGVHKIFYDKTGSDKNITF
jgi:hypothetical protein